MVSEDAYGVSLWESHRVQSGVHPGLEMHGARTQLQHFTHEGFSTRSAC